MSKTPPKKNELNFVFFYSKEKDKYLEFFKKMIAEKIEKFGR